MNSFASKLLPGAVLLLAAALGSGCPRQTTEEACASCENRQAYRCPVGSTNNIICANDDAQALTLCPEGPTALNCEGGSGGQAAAPAPENKTPDAKLESKKAK